ncbi:hypothetical protein [Novacetimonas hansenii]|uniref:hypothetical protein n=1 Tax=Novacetimonas hansenii TaxID=436 RepID=UPI0011154827|nr:hypothetical protein [Novacetimonas hansenii]
MVRRPSVKKNIPDKHHVVRYVPLSRQSRDDDGNLVGNGLLWVAFQQKKDEAFVSVNWLEYYECDDRNEGLKAVRRDLAAAFPPRPSSKALLAIGNVGNIKRACADAGKPVRVTHEPSHNNPSHAGIRKLPTENEDLLETLAAEIFIDTVLAAGLI